MIPIRIIDNDFNLLGEIDNYTSLQWIRRFYKSGEFELHINPDMQYANKLKKDNIIYKVDNPKEAGIINYINIENRNDEQELVIKGSFLDSLVNRRITIPPINKAYDKVNINAESALKHYVNVNCINPINLNRFIPNLILAENKNRGCKITYQSRYKKLNEELEKISIATDLGWNILFDIKHKKFIFDVIEGNDLTANQNKNPPVIFSPDFNNVESQNYTNSDIGYKNVGIIGGQGEGENRKIISINNELQGLNRYETFIDARDIPNKKESEILTEQEINEQLTDRGKQKLSELKEIESFESKILNNSNLIYKKDYNLGDIVTIQNRKWGITLNTRIIELKEIIEQNGFTIDGVFGNSTPTLIEKIKKEMRG